MTIVAHRVIGLGERGFRVRVVVYFLALRELRSYPQ
jgi:hypothetical protein